MFRFLQMSVSYIRLRLAANNFGVPLVLELRFKCAIRSGFPLFIITKPMNERRTMIWNP